VSQKKNDLLAHENSAGENRPLIVCAASDRTALRGEAAEAEKRIFKREDEL